MGALLVVALLIGLDNLQAAAGIGMLPLRQARKWHIALAFAVFEAAMPLLGLLIGDQLLASLGRFSAGIAPICLAGCGLLIIGLALREREQVETAAGVAALANSRWVLFGLPLSLSIDNLLAGVALGSLGIPLVPAVLVLGAISGTMSLLGMFVGAGLRTTLSERLPKRLDLVSGACLVVIALMTVFLDS